MVRLCKHLANVGSHIHIGGGRGAQAHADVLLRDIDDVFGLRISSSETLHQRALTRAGNATDHAEDAQWQLHGDVFQVVERGGAEGESP